jgi:hypothetical protein
MGIFITFQYTGLAPRVLMQPSYMLRDVMLCNQIAFLENMLCNQVTCLESLSFGTSYMLRDVMPCNQIAFLETICFATNLHA